MYIVFKKYRDEWGNIHLIRHGRLLKSYAAAKRLCDKQKLGGYVQMYGGKNHGSIPYDTILSKTA